MRATHSLWLTGWVGLLALACGESKPGNPTTENAGGQAASGGNSSTVGNEVGGSSSQNTGGTAGADASAAGVIRLGDTVPGFASTATEALPQGTTGGGMEASAIVEVSSFAELKTAATSATPAIILMAAGTYEGSLVPTANKTIIGKEAGVVLQGNVKISGSAVSNIILRNFSIRGNPCASYDACKSGADALAIENSAHHVWLDHLDIADGQDGNCDITKQADYVTVSFSQFHYTYDKEHRFSNLISSDDGDTADEGKLHITYMDCIWGERVDQRQPRGRYGQVHLLNNLFASQVEGQIMAGPGVKASYVIENNFYEVPSGTDAVKLYDSSATVAASGNEGSAEGMNSTVGTAFTPPYPYAALSAAEVKAKLTAAVGGAGASCTYSSN